MSMEREDTIKPNFRQAGRLPQGKLLRGFIQDPINKTTSASIPYKFETILYKNTNPKGFGASAQKLVRSEDLGPGPGSYDSETTLSTTNTTSYSKKGYGNGFASETARLLYRGFVNTGPGPGAYNPLDKPFRVTHISHESKRSDTTPKLQPGSSDLPGPGFYNPDINKTSGVLNSRVVNSIFKSNTGRYRMTGNSNPPPGTYEVQGDLVEKKPYKHYLGSSNFMLPTTKKASQETKNKEAVDQILGVENPVTKDVPGPGHYFDAEKDDEIVLFNQKIKAKNSSTFMVGNATRFGEVIKRKVKRFDYPGPGTYLEVFDQNQEKTLVSGAVFMSETARKPFRETKTFIGPMKYNPELLPKKSYHLNINKNWV